MNTERPQKIEDLDELIIDGINITRQAQEGDALYSDNQFLAVDVHHRFVLWRFNIREFVSKYYPKSAQKFFEADSVPDMKGGIEYGDVTSEKSQTLLKNIREETSKKLGLLRQLKKKRRWWEQTWVQVLGLVGALASIIGFIFYIFSK